MNGARALVKNQLLNARYAIIGEPTNLKPIRMHKGIAMQRIHVRGKSGHSSNPKLGHNAIEAMHQVLAELLTFRKELQSSYQNPAFDICEPTMNLGCIHGGDNPNRICGECHLDFDIRPLPGMNLSALRDQLNDRLSRLGLEQEVELSTENLIGGVEAYEEPRESELVSLAESLTGERSQSVAFATEAPFLQALGMQTIVMGPGSIDQAHQPNEFLALDQIQPAIQIIKSAIIKSCL
jgi:acetylornithine deacetylase